MAKKQIRLSLSISRVVFERITASTCVEFEDIVKHWDLAGACFRLAEGALNNNRVHELR